jgi:hypothetical protein
MFSKMNRYWLWHDGYSAVSFCSPDEGTFSKPAAVGDVDARTEAYT